MSLWWIFSLLTEKEPFARSWPVVQIGSRPHDYFLFILLVRKIGGLENRVQVKWFMPGAAQLCFEANLLFLIYLVM